MIEVRRAGTILLWMGTLACASSPQPYAGLEQRDIKALSDAEVVEMLAGGGMGLALSAELNGYPGPLHVIELASDLGLDPQTLRTVERLRSDMLERARALGEQIVEAERELDRAFSGHGADAEGVRDQTLRIGRLTGELRATHLLVHLETAHVLTADQRRRYAELRGYAHGGGDHGGHTRSAGQG